MWVSPESEITWWQPGLPTFLEFGLGKLFLPSLGVSCFRKTPSTQGSILALVLPLVVKFKHIRPSRLSLPPVSETTHPPTPGVGTSMHSHRQDSSLCQEPPSVPTTIWVFAFTTRMFGCCPFSKGRYESHLHGLPGATCLLSPYSCIGTHVGGDHLQRTLDLGMGVGLSS